MVKFGQYFDSQVQQKPEWSKAFIDYNKLNGILGEMKQRVKALCASEHETPSPLRRSRSQLLRSSDLARGGITNNSSMTSPPGRAGAVTDAEEAPAHRFQTFRKLDNVTSLSRKTSLTMGNSAQKPTPVSPLSPGKTGPPASGTQYTTDEDHGTPRTDRTHTEDEFGRSVPGRDGSAFLDSVDESRGASAAPLASSHDDTGGPMSLNWKLEPSEAEGPSASSGADVPVVVTGHAGSSDDENAPLMRGKPPLAPGMKKAHSPPSMHNSNSTQSPPSFSKAPIGPGNSPDLRPQSTRGSGDHTRSSGDHQYTRHSVSRPPPLLIPIGAEDTARTTPGAPPPSLVVLDANPVDIPMSDARDYASCGEQGTEQQTHISLSMQSQVPETPVATQLLTHEESQLLERREILSKVGVTAFGAKRGGRRNLPRRAKLPQRDDAGFFSLDDIQSAAMSPQLNEVVAMAINFEKELTVEVKKATQFIETAVARFQGYLHESVAVWQAPDSNKDRNKDNIRYLHRELCHLISFIDTNELAMKTALKKYSHCCPVIQDVKELSKEWLYSQVAEKINEHHDVVLALRARTEDIFADLFNDGDVTMAKSRIGARYLSFNQAFRAGFFAALNLAVLMYWMHVLVEMSPSEAILKRLRYSFPVLRFFTSLIFLLTCWSFCLYFWHKYRVNYLYVFEFSQHQGATALSVLEIGLFMMLLCNTAFIMYLRLQWDHVPTEKDAVQGYPPMAPYIIPLFILIFVGLIAYPARRTLHRTRNAFFKTFRRLLVLPFGHVRFVEFCIADIGTSLVYPLMDLLYTVCYFTVNPEQDLNNHLSPWNTCHTVRMKWGWGVALIPYFWRACQTAKMYRQTNNRVHIINHFKYESMMLTLVLMWGQQWDLESKSLNVAVWFWHIVSQLYAGTWDILMDWGWVKGKSRNTMLPRKYLFVYFVVMVWDIAARMYWIATSLWIGPHVLDTDVLIMIQANVEILRRSIWSIFRVENENFNNLETYRSIDFVPEVSVPDKEE